MSCSEALINASACNKQSLPQSRSDFFFGDMDSSKPDKNNETIVQEIQGSEETNSYNFDKDLCVWLRFKLPLAGEIRFNPIVSFVSIALIVLFSSCCLVLKQDAPFFALTDLIVDKFTWLYIGGINCWTVFIIYLYFRWVQKKKKNSAKQK